ncbi:hypothetical protein DSCA_12470 [Desulfosarcina alkanivorans]|uniref:Uncharacterized protein n=1 Tax=Desulfosarcina alkanivorans TaxID=571177 RepID=A0A5K7YRP4_9BACT|nr:outer membrane beta-barrel protein [Desulfosarcina alkanivorans]BBO67317.1 hypothetical protein DSCA_12470 [Desulfosarcina alkanivorans]
MKKTSGIVLAVALSLCSTTYLHAAMEITPRLSAGVEYTDNVRLVSDDFADTESDTITTITPGITIDLSGRTAGLALSYDASHVDYYDDSYDAYWSHAATADGWWQSGRNTRLSLTHAFLYTEDPIDNDDLTIRRSRNPYTRNSTSARIDHQFGADNTLYAEGLYSSLENDDPTIEDSQYYGGGAGATYWFNVRWGLDAGADYYQGRYDDGVDDYSEIVGRLRGNHRFNPRLTGYLAYEQTLHRADEDSEVDYDVYDGAVGIDYAIGPTMDLSAGLHYVYLDVDDGDSESVTPVNISLTKRFQRGSISFTGEGGYNYTSVTAENLGVYEYYEAGLSADYAFTQRLTGDVEGVYGNRDYLSTTPSRSEDVLRAGCGLSFQLLRWLSMRAGYTYRMVDSSIDVDDYVENRASLMFTLAPPQPYRF